MKVYNVVCEAWNPIDEYNSVKVLGTYRHRSAAVRAMKHQVAWDDLPKLLMTEKEPPTLWYPVDDYPTFDSRYIVGRQMDTNDDDDWYYTWCFTIMESDFILSDK